MFKCWRCECNIDLFTKILGFDCLSSLESEETKRNILRNWKIYYILFQMPMNDCWTYVFYLFCKRQYFLLTKGCGNTLFLIDTFCKMNILQPWNLQKYEEPQWIPCRQTDFSYYHLNIELFPFHLKPWWISIGSFCAFCQILWSIWKLQLILILQVALLRN